MTTAVSQTTPEQRRAAKAQAILADSGQWGRGSFRDGRPFYAVPSQCQPGLFHMTDGRECTCQDFRRHGGPCKHARAVAAFQALSAQPAPVAPRQQPQERACVECGARVRAESIYRTCGDCTNPAAPLLAA